jgi:hypothetical protein
MGVVVLVVVVVVVMVMVVVVVVVMVVVVMVVVVVVDVVLVVVVDVVVVDLIKRTRERWTYLAFLGSLLTRCTASPSPLRERRVTRKGERNRDDVVVLDCRRGVVVLRARLDIPGALLRAHRSRNVARSMGRASCLQQG